MSITHIPCRLVPADRLEVVPRSLSTGEMALVVRSATRGARSVLIDQHGAQALLEALVAAYPSLLLPLSRQPQPSRPALPAMWLGAAAFDNQENPA